MKLKMTKKADLKKKPLSPPVSSSPSIKTGLLNLASSKFAWNVFLKVRRLSPGLSFWQSGAFLIIAWILLSNFSKFPLPSLFNGQTIWTCFLFCFFPVNHSSLVPLEITPHSSTASSRPFPSNARYIHESVWSSSFPLKAQISSPVLV